MEFVIISQTDFQVLQWSSFYISNGNYYLKSSSFATSASVQFNKMLPFSFSLVCRFLAVFIPHLRTICKAELLNLTALEEVSKFLWCTGSFFCCWSTRCPYGFVFHLSFIAPFSLYHLVLTQRSIGTCFSRAISKSVGHVRPEMLKNTDSSGNL